jgi:hypothetical protein
MNVSDVLKWLEFADDFEIGEVIKAVILMNGKIYPEEEMLVISLPRNNAEERQRTICEILKIINL